MEGDVGKIVQCKSCGNSICVPAVHAVVAAPPVAEPPVVEPLKQPPTQGILGSIPDRSAIVQRKRIAANRFPWSASFGVVFAGILLLSVIVVFRFTASLRVSDDSNPIPMAEDHIGLTAVERQTTGGRAADPRGDTFAEPEVGNIIANNKSPGDPAPDAVLKGFLADHCFKCHGDAKQESELNLASLMFEVESHETAEAWRDVLDRLTLDEMPPVGEGQPTPSKKQLVVQMLRQRLDHFYEQAVAGDGQVVMRRLNRDEYANSIRDLTGIEFDVQDANFPADSDDLGFDTIGSDLTVSPALLQKYLSAAAVIANAVVSSDPLDDESPRTRVFGELEPIENLTQTRELLRRFASRAFRRPVSSQKLDRLSSLVQSKLNDGKTLDEGIRFAIQAILCSPQFLYFIEQPGPLDEYALATRISYFLWSSTPDEELLRHAQKGSLRDPGVLDHQVQRMLNDPKSKSFVQRFVGQWLDTQDVGVMQPDKKLFPDYDLQLEQSMGAETEAFFEEILRNNLRIDNFIDSDFAMLNERLAKHYGVDGVHGETMRRVAIKKTSNRGGVLGHASVLSVTSDGVRSSPVVRGVWILKNLLGDPPSPPPSNVPDLEPDTRGAKTIREELARHRNIASCNGCHRKIDPLGFALEGYDAVGQWRTHYARSSKGNKTISIPVDTEGQLPDGTKFYGAAELKRFLLSRKSEFRHCLTEKLLSYATGRVLTYRDHKSVEAIAADVAKNGDGMQFLVTRIVNSELFQTK